MIPENQITRILRKICVWKGTKFHLRQEMHSSCFSHWVITWQNNWEEEEFVLELSWIIVQIPIDPWERKQQDRSTWQKLLTLWWAGGRSENRQGMGQRPIVSSTGWGGAAEERQLSRTCLPWVSFQWISFSELPSSKFLEPTKWCISWWPVLQCLLGTFNI